MESWLGCGRKIESVERLHPDTDISGLEDLENIERYIERVDLFTVKFAPEVEANSKFQWHRGSNGDYMLLLLSSLL